MDKLQKINLKKFDKMAKLAFENGLRLHFDSIKLFNSDSFPSAYFLSSLALEEIGKSFVLIDLLFYCWIDGGIEKIYENFYIKAIYSHQAKQNKFASFFDSDSSYNPKSFFDKLHEGELEALKQNSLYVGLGSKRKNISLKGRITSPLNVSKEKAKKQITSIQNSIVETCFMVMKGHWLLESDDLEKMLNKNLFLKLITIWPYLNNNLKRRIHKIESFYFKD